jgi:hypothetical protein
MDAPWGKPGQSFYGRLPQYFLGMKNLFEDRLRKNLSDAQMK